MLLRTAHPAVTAAWLRGHRLVFRMWRCLLILSLAKGGAKILERGTGCEGAGKVGLKRTKSRANHPVRGRKAERFHLAPRLLGSPTLLRDSVGGDHHARAIHAILAMDEDLCVWIIAQNTQEFRDGLAGHVRALRWNRNVLHA